MQVNGGFEAEADVGPMITPEAKARCEQLIQAGIDQVGPRDSRASYVGGVGRYARVGFGWRGAPPPGVAPHTSTLHRPAKGSVITACQGLSDHSLPRCLVITAC